MASVDGKAIWKRLMSTKYNVPYWFNETTGESRWDEPAELTAAAPEQKSSSAGLPPAPAADAVSRKRPRSDEETAAGDTTNAAPAVAASGAPAAPAPASAQTENCPEHLLWKRKYLFKGFSSDQVEKLKMDEVSAFSITEAYSATTMTALIWDALRRVMGRKSPGDTCILDGMACVGGNTISFSNTFSRVLSNELDASRFGMLQHNTEIVMQRKNVEFFNRSVLELAFERNDYDIIFLDPEWGGPDYKDKTNLVLPISGESMEEFVLAVLHRMPRVSVVALKLPLNYDNGFIEDFARKNALKYEFYTEGMKKMSLTLLTKLN